ncbi:MAG TPA: hypothetical protein VF627_01795 [Abditibacterium sp.]|jgi:hypothetical protein
MDSSSSGPEPQAGERVEIGGRTMLRPGFSLVGLTGIVFPTAPNAPAECLTVAVDWIGHGYTEEAGYPDGSLPLFVNVPVAHLTPAQAPQPPKVEPKPVKPASKFPHAKPAKPPGDEPEEERPKLRLV